MTPDASVQPQTTGFTTALDGAAQPAAENTQDFLAAAAEAARPAPQPEPEEPPAPPARIPLKSWMWIARLP